MLHTAEKSTGYAANECDRQFFVENGVSTNSAQRANRLISFWFFQILPSVVLANPFKFKDLHNSCCRVSTVLNICVSIGTGGPSPHLGTFYLVKVLSSDLILISQSTSSISRSNTFMPGMDPTPYSDEIEILNF